MHDERQRLDADLLAGVSLREVGRRYGVSKDTAHRHQDHIAADVRAEVRERAEVDVQALASRIASIADDARATRLHAQSRGDHRAALRASEVELRTLDMLAVRLGIDSTAVVEQMAAAQGLMRAVVVTLRHRAELLPDLLCELRSSGFRDVADSLDSYMNNTTATPEGIEQ